MEDDGTVVGVDRGATRDTRRSIANVPNGPNPFRPAPLAEAEDVDCDDRVPVRVWVPMGPSAYGLRDTVYDRLADAGVFRASVPVGRTAAGSGQSAVLSLAASTVEHDGSPAASEIARAGDVSVRTARRRVRAQREAGRLASSAGDARRYVLAESGDTDAK